MLRAQRGRVGFQPAALTVTLLTLVFATGPWAKMEAKTPAELQLAAVALLWSVSLSINRCESTCLDKMTTPPVTIP